MLRGVALLPAALFLASCGESDNFSSSNAGTVSSCSAITGASCITGRLIDDAATNVNYECGVSGLGTVNNVTNDRGEFICPDGSEVTFSLIHPENKLAKLVLGSVIVTKPADIFVNSSEENRLPVYFYVTMRDLARDETTVLSSAAINLARLLQALSRDTVSPELPSYRVIIHDDDKRKLTPEIVEAIQFTAPPETTNPSDPGPGTFDASVQPFLQAFEPDKQLLDVATAEKRISRGIYSTLAGVYETFDPFSLVPNPGNVAPTGGITGAGSAGNFIGAMWNLVDRKGRAYASGVYSYTSSSTTMLSTAPKPFTLDNSRWPIDAGLGALTYSLRDESGATTGETIDITQGNIKREVVAGSVPIYQNLFGESPSDTDLGRWQLTENAGSSVPISNGKLTMARIAPVASVLDPTLWKASLFPLPLTVTVRNLDRSSSEPLGSLVGTFRMVVLSDGNIISDMSAKCGVDINQDTLQYPSGGTEVSLGVVARILDTAINEQGNTMETMTLLGLIPDIPHFRTISPYLPYLQFGSNLSEASLLRVDAGANASRLYGACTVDRLEAGLCTAAGTLADDLATWENRYTKVKFRSLGSTASPTDPLNLNSAGFMSSVPTPAASCVTPP